LAASRNDEALVVVAESSRMSRLRTLAAVLPTRNRSGLAKVAIDSVLANKPEEVHLVVSDNSTEDEHVSDLRAYCEPLRARGVEYVRPDRPLSMTRHWDWIGRRVLASPDTTHVLFLADRMIFKRGWLSRLVDVVRRHPEHLIMYIDDSIVDDLQPVRLVQNRWSGQLVEVSSRRLLEQAAEMMLHPAPRMLNCVAPREVMEAVRDRFGEVFGSVSPDFCFAYRALYLTDRLCFWDAPPVLHYGRTDSNGWSFARGVPSDASRDFLRELEEPFNGRAPLPQIPTPGNAVVHEYCRAREETGSEKFPPVNRDRYLQLMHQEVAALQNLELKANLEALLAAQGEVHKRRPMLRILQSALSAPARLLPQAFWRTLARTVRISPPGDAPLEFATAQAAMEHVDAHPRRRHLSALHLRVLLGKTKVLGRY
jgi:hypothetical protein